MECIVLSENRVRNGKGFRVQDEKLYFMIFCCDSNKHIICGWHNDE